MKNNRKSRVLVVVAHPDDELLGVGGAILKHRKNGDDVSILILGDGETSRGEGADIPKREAQARSVATVLGVETIYLEKLPDNRFDSLTLLDVVKKVEEYVQRVKPDIVYTHHYGDVNVDHKVTFQAVLTACRPLPDFFVKKILCFETVSSTEWERRTPERAFLPTEYQNIEMFMDKKIEALDLYKEEMRSFPHPRSLEGVRIHAQHRGMEVGYKYAEAFEVIRNLVD